jgi:hypothetical protein
MIWFLIQFILLILLFRGTELFILPKSLLGVTGIPKTLPKGEPAVPETLDYLGVYLELL